jgi:hypothetical protein
MSFRPFLTSAVRCGFTHFGHGTDLRCCSNPDPEDEREGSFTAADERACTLLFGSNQ